MLEVLADYVGVTALTVVHTPYRRLARRLTTTALVFLLMAPLWVAPAAFASPGGGWSSAMDLTSAGYSYYSDVCSDRTGNAMAVYTEWSGSAYNAYARRFVSGLGWQAQTPIDPASSDAESISVACDPMGDAFVAWGSWNGTAYTVRVARYTADWGWGAVQALSPMNFNTYTVETAMDGAGAGYVVAWVYNGTGYQLRATRLDANGTLAPTIRMDNTTNTIYELKVSSSAAPGFIAVWSQYNGTNTDLLSMRHNGTAWQARLRVETKDGGLDTPNVGLDDQGNALTVFRQSVGGYYTWYSTSGPTSGWTAQQYVGTSDGGSLAVSPGGPAVFVGYHWNGSAAVNGAYRYTPGVGFDAVIAGQDATSSYPSVAMDPSGNVFAGYTIWNGTQYLARAQFFSGTQWSAGFSLDVNGTTDNDIVPQGAMLANGHVLAVWNRYTPAYNYYTRAAVYSAPDTLPPYVKITSPYSGAVVSDGYIGVAGYTDPGSDVSVNGFKATVFASGYFEVSIPLTVGNHWLSARAVDAAGNAGYSNSIYVTDQDPQALANAERAQAGKAGWQDLIGVEQVDYWGAWWPRVQSDRNGNAFMVWYEDAYDGNHAYVARYTNGTGWGVPIELQSAEGQLSGAPRLAVDDGGNLTVVWCTYAWDGSWSHVYAEFFTPLYGWTGPYRLDSAERFAWWPDVAVDNQMRHHMVWQQRDEVTFNYSISSRIFGPNGYYLTGPVRIETAVGSNDVPRIAFDASGRGYASFRNNNGSGVNLALARYNGASWNGTQVLQPVPGDQWNHPLAADAGGNVTIATRTWNGTQQNYSAGRFWANGSWSGNALVWGNSWDWDPEVVADGSGRAFISFTASTAGNGSGAYVAVAAPGAMPGVAVNLDGTITDDAGGPKLSKGVGGSPVRVHFDEWFNGIWHPEMREYNASNGSWGPIIYLSPQVQGGHVPDVAPMPDGGYMVVYVEDNSTLGFGQAVARRFTPLDTTPPALAITSPTDGATLGVSFVEVRGSTEVGARVWVNNIEVAVAANGTFATVVSLVNGSNTINARAQDLNGNLQNRSVTVRFDDPALALIANLTTQNQALQAQLNLTNSTLWTALVGQNASLLGQLAAQNASLAAAIAAGDSSLLARLVAQNATLQQAIGNLNASLLASLAAQNASLASAIAAGDSSLLAQLLAQNASLLDQITGLNASLVASLAAQDSALLANIAATNASLLTKLAAQNASVTASLGNLNRTLLASLAAQDAQLTALIASTNATLLADLAAQNGALTDLIASTNSSLLASLAAQNDALRAHIEATNATLLASLAAQNSTLQAKITADHNENAAANTAQDTSLSATQAAVDSARAAASGAGTMALLGILIGAAGIGVGAMAFLSSKRRPPQIDGPTPSPHAEEVSMVDHTAAGAASRGHSMGAEGEVAGRAENDG